MNFAEIGRDRAFNCLIDTHSDLEGIKIKIYDVIECLADKQKIFDCLDLVVIMKDITKIQNKIEDDL